MKKDKFEKGDRVESLVEPVGEKGTVESIEVGDWRTMSIKWDKLWRNAKISISHDSVFTDDNGTDIFKLIK